MPIHPSRDSYQAYSPDLAVFVHIPGSSETTFRRDAYVLDSPSKTLHLYEERQLPAIPPLSVTQTILDDLEAIMTDSDYSDVDSLRSPTPRHIIECLKEAAEYGSGPSNELSLFPLPLNTRRQANKSTDEPFTHPKTSSSFRAPLTPPTSKYATFSRPASPLYGTTAADVPTGASMEIEKHNSSWSLAVYSPSNTIALFRLSINRRHSFMRQQNTKGMSRVAMICAGPSDPLKVTVTGYLDKPSELPGHQLPNSLWTCKVLALCQEIGHVAALSLLDRGVAGLHNCCHAEKQAVAYLHFERPELRKATIHLSDDPCSDCARFLRRYRVKSGKEIDIVVYGWKWQDQAVGRHLGTSLRTVL